MRSHHLRTASLRTLAVAATAALTLAAGCEAGGLAPDDGLAHLSLALTGVQGTVELDVPAGAYDIGAAGTATDAGAFIDITLTDGDGALVASAALELTLDQADASAGAVGAGGAAVDATAGGQLHVAVPFKWSGASPTAGLNLELAFEHAPTIDLVKVLPAPFIGVGGSIWIDVLATNQDGPADELAFEGRLLPQAGGVGQKFVLAALGDGSAEVAVVAPAEPGLYDLEITVRDAYDGATVFTKELQVLDADGLALLDEVDEATMVMEAMGWLHALAQQPAPPALKQLLGLQGVEVWEGPSGETLVDTDADGTADVVYDGDSVEMDLEGGDERETTYRDADGDGTYEEATRTQGGKKMLVVEIGIEVVVDETTGLVTMVILWAPPSLIVVLDSDGDGKLDTVKIDADGDGVFEKTGLDTDGDGKVDLTREDKDGNGKVDSGKIDKNGDGIADTFISDPDEDGKANVVISDSNGDGVSDTSWVDSNGDGVIQTGEVQTYNAPMPGM